MQKSLHNRVILLMSRLFPGEAMEPDDTVFAISKIAAARTLSGDRWPSARSRINSDDEYAEALAQDFYFLGTSKYGSEIELVYKAALQTPRGCAMNNTCTLCAVLAELVAKDYAAVRVSELGIWFLEPTKMLIADIKNTLEDDLED